MEFVSALLLGIALSMDAFAVSVCKGLSMQKASLKNGLVCGLWFGSFQALMPTIGFFLGTLFADAIQAIDHWVAFGLLAIIGINMLKEAMGSEEECACCQAESDFSVKTMFLMAVATSIDAMAVGISLNLDGKNIFLAVPLIGGFTFLLSAIGVKVGSLFGAKLEKKAQILGGVILICLGLKILIEDLLLG